MSKLVMLPSFRAVGQTHAKWQAFERKKTKIRDKCIVVSLPYICLLFSGFSNVYQSACVWPTTLKVGCVTNFDMLFLVMGFMVLVVEIQFMLISSCHIWIKSIITNN